MQQPLDKQFTDLRLGLVTEAGFLNSPEGSTTDEANFRLLVDGSRRRRRGVRLETGGTNDYLPNTVQNTDAVSEGEWRNAGGDPDSDLIALQLGQYIYFFKNTGDTLSTQQLGFRLNLFPYFSKASGSEYATYPVSFASGNGVLLVCGRYIDPLYLEYDPATEDITPHRFSIYERDFQTLKEGGVAFNTEPTTLTDIHKYNLRNRGWKEADITTYEAGASKYPALGMLWYKGYARAVDGTTYINEDGVKAFNWEKMEAEPFGNASAPTGSLLINPFDTTTAYQTQPNRFEIQTGWTRTDLGSTWTVTITTDSAHGLSVGNPFIIEGNQFLYTWDEPEPGLPSAPDFPWSLDGEYTVASAPTSTTLTFTFDEPTNFAGFDDQYNTLGFVYTGSGLSNPSTGYTTEERPQVCGWYAGRAWFAGIEHPNLVDRIYFSRLQYPGERTMGECYQRNDPTDETFNSLLPDDGGTIVISDLGKVQGFLEFNGSWLVFTNEGVWEIRGNRGVFTADNYGVRKLSDNECTSKFGFYHCEGMVVYTGTKGIFSIVPDPNTGILYSNSISLTQIQSEWNAIPNVKQRRTKVRYDDANKQVYVLTATDATDTYKYAYDRAYVYDMKLQAWCKFTFRVESTDYMVGLWPLRDADATESYKKMKFFVLRFGEETGLDICDMAQTSFADWHDNEESAYMIMSYDNIGSWAHKRQAPVLHMFMAKTETGFTELLAPVNESSLKVQARWDWADHANAGEWGTEIQAYRHNRAYVPASAADPFNTGYPVVVTRNKLRGRGRALNLKFSTDEGKDAHLLGYAVRYKVSGRV